jgi:hypothetical protein
MFGGFDYIAILSHNRGEHRVFYKEQWETEVSAADKAAFGSAFSPLPEVEVPKPAEISPGQDLVFQVNKGGSKVKAIVRIRDTGELSAASKVYPIEQWADAKAEIGVQLQWKFT